MPPEQIFGHIQTVAIIDDAYDPPVRGSFIEEDIVLFFDALADEEGKEALDVYSIQLSDSSGVDDEVVAKLWSVREQLAEGPLREACNSLFDTIADRATEVNSLCRILRDDFKLRVECYGLNDLAGIEYGPFQVVFLDYYLDPAVATDSPTRRRARENARKVATSIHNQASPDHETRPLIILMSSMVVSQEESVRFRDDSSLLGGMYYFVPKSQLSTTDRLFIRMKALGLALPIGHKISSFVDAVINSVGEAADKLRQDIKKLSIEDYAYVHRLSLLEDGHPLSDYMMWLWSSYFGHLLFHAAAVATSQRQFDRLSFERLPPMQAEPSYHLIDLYMSALFDLNARDLGIQSRTPEQEELEKPTLHLGDLFVKDASSDVLLVINAQCDLAYSPNGKRRFPVDRTIIFVPGVLKPLAELFRRDSDVRTELFEYESRSYRIIWDVRDIQTCTYGNVESWLNSQAYKWVGRLRLPYALQIQQSFASRLTRVGMPVPPPIYQPVQVQLLVKAADRSYCSLAGPSDGVAFLVVTSLEAIDDRTIGQKLVLTVDFICRLRDELSALNVSIEADVAALVPGIQGFETRRDRMAEQLNKVRAVLDDPNMWSSFMLPFMLPRTNEEIPLVGTMSIDTCPVNICLNRNLTGRYQSPAPMLLNVIDVLDKKEVK